MLMRLSIGHTSGIVPGEISVVARRCWNSAKAHKMMISLGRHLCKTGLPSLIKQRSKKEVQTEWSNRVEYPGLPQCLFGTSGMHVYAL